MNYFDQVLSKERPVYVVPKVVLAALFIGLVLQLTWHALRPSATVIMEDLPAPITEITLQAASLGEPAALARALMLWLQAFDNQPGISVPFEALDYSKVIGWLDRILALDKQSHYPLLSASRVYSEVPVIAKKRQMLEFVYTKFLQDPNKRWPWMAHSVYIAKHRIKDLTLAYKYAEALRLRTTDEHIPDWAKQMELFILEDMGDIESAKVLIGGMLESGVIEDPNELKFFLERIEKTEKDNIKDY